MEHNEPLTARAARMTRRGAIGAMAVAGVGFVAFGPRRSGDAPSDRLILDYWEKWTGHEGQAMRGIVDEFNASQSRIHVRYFSMSAIDQKALIAIAGGSPPDILGLWNYNIPAYAESGALMALDGFAGARGISSDRYTPAVWRLMTHRGNLWGMINTSGTVALYYNKTLFRERGLDPERPPRTIEEFNEVNDRLTEIGANGAITRMGFLHTQPGWWSWLWGYPFGGSIFDERAGVATADAPENILGYTWAQSLPERLGTKPLITFQSGLGMYGTAQHPFLTGQVAMVNQGPWLANVVNAYQPDMDYGVAPFPVLASIYREDAPIGLVDGDVLVVPRGAKHPEASFEFIAFTQRPEIVERLSRLHCKNSPLARVSPSFLEGHPNRAIGVHNRIAQSSRAFVFPRTRVWPEYVAEFDSGMQRIWGMTQSPAQALGQIQTRASQAIRHAQEQDRRRGKVVGVGA